MTSELLFSFDRLDKKFVFKDTVSVHHRRWKILIRKNFVVKISYVILLKITYEKRYLQYTNCIYQSIALIQ